MDLKTKVSEISGVGPAYVKKLNKIGIETVSDLLFHFPRRYDDFSNVLSIAKARPGKNVSVKGNIWQIASKKSRRGVAVLEAVIADDTGTIKAIWFNRQFLKNNLKVGDNVVLAGKPEWNYGTIQMVSPSFEVLSKNEKEKSGENVIPTQEGSEPVRIGDSSFHGMTGGVKLTHVGRIIPVYPETEGLTSKWLRLKIKPLLKYVNELEEYLPETFKEKHQLLDIQKAIKELHFPSDLKNLEKAKRRIDFEEMFFLQLAVLSQKKELRKEKAPKINFDEGYTKEFISRLGFKLTNAQRKAAFEIFKDMEKDIPMNRLLEGDVGSGKTLVAAMALAMTAKNSYQSVIIAPTEILAKQHFEGLKSLLPDFNLGLLTSGSVILTKEGSLSRPTRASLDSSIPRNDKGGGNASKKQITNNKKNESLNPIKDGEVDIVIGTHSLFQETVEFKKLGLVVIDEQHRFGVEQRTILRKENKAGLTPHFLSMSATPIPRTLTLTVYGDLDVSILDELPPGRKSITSRLVENEKRVKAYEFIEEKIKEGRQIFVVCPMVEESDKLGVKSVTKEYEKLKIEIFPNRKIAMLHGKMKSVEKETIMNSFVKGELDILVATSVIEVGVNVPNASIMMIEGAERFGLAQLHQFRGRVGRGGHKSYCLLFSESSNEVTLKRLNSFVNLSDGFKLAEIDLEIRGPGEVFGKSQHGLPDIKTKNLMNIKLIKETRKAAEEFLETENLNNFPLLKEKIDSYDIIRTLE